VKIRLHIKVLSVPPRRRQGLTILEMLVSTAMLAFIVVGLTVVFVQTQRAFKTGIKETTITDAARTIVEMITADLGQMSDGQNTNVNNFHWGLTTYNAANRIVNYDSGLAIRTNQLEELYILERTNTTWVGVGYAVSNLLSPSGAPLAVGTLYRFETNWNSPYPALTNLIRPIEGTLDPFYSVFLQTSDSTMPNLYFNSNYWHPVADGVIDLELRAFDQNGNDAGSHFFTNYNYFSYPSYYYTNDIYSWEYPIMPQGIPTNALPKALPNAAELEFAILEPEALAQARSLAVNPAALQSYLGSNAATRMEVFRQRVSVAAATR
jgi:hypothetical protein